MLPREILSTLPIRPTDRARSWTRSSAADAITPAYTASKTSAYSISSEDCSVIELSDPARTVGRLHSGTKIPAFVRLEDENGLQDRTLMPLPEAPFRTHIRLDAS